MPYGAERPLHLTDVGPVVRVGQFPHRSLADPEPAGKLHFGDALSTHGRVECKLGGNDGRYSHEFLALSHLCVRFQVYRWRLT